MRISNALVSLVLALPASLAFAWGDTGHKTINVTAAELMESPAAGFFRTNRDALAAMATVPDVEWKHSNYDQEKPYHFFQWDRYATSAFATAQDVDFKGLLAAVGAGFVTTNGPAPWRAGQIYGRLVQALKAGQYARALQMAGVLGHYLGDLSQPMHNSSDYDGQSIGRKGLHIYYEVTLVDRVDARTLRDNVLDAGGPARQRLDAVNIDTTAADLGAESVRHLAVTEGQAAFADLGDLLANPDDRDLTDTLAERMGAAAAVLAKVLDAAIAASGIDASSLPTPPQAVTAPAWFPLN
jgi:hypothetical protein